MEIRVIAASVVALLSLYFAKGAEESAEVVGEAAAEKMGILYQTIKKRFKGNAYAEQTLTRAEEKPESEGRQTALKEQLAGKMEEDADFAETVCRLIEELVDVTDGTFVACDVTVVGSGTVTVAQRIDTVDAGGSVTGARISKVGGGEPSGSGEGRPR